MQEWRELDFKGTEEAEVEEDWEEVMDNWYVTIPEGQDIMLAIVRIQHDHHACIVHCLIMRQMIVPHW